MEVTPKQTVAAFRKLLDEAEIATAHRAATIRMGTEVLYIPHSSGKVVVLIDSDRYECCEEGEYAGIDTKDPEKAIEFIREILSPTKEKEES
ncbi:hypothetical protein AB0G15_05795 [Streptosporangium sp. NPDC023825]|uniref:hypothetical protein n=1 Tax=Streptosporangium sp. NPDC023825 TaxID=3154909 RepID=UPI0034266D26